MSELTNQQLSHNLRRRWRGILAKNQHLAEQVDVAAVVALLPLIQHAERIFVVGAGRTGLALRAAARRLMHLGRTAGVVGETTTPATGAGNLLLAGSGLGTTSTSYFVLTPYYRPR